MDDKVIIISADGHCGGPPEGYRDYLDPKYRDLLQTALQPEHDVWVKLVPTHTSVSPEILEFSDPDRNIRDGGEASSWDWDLRLKQLDHEGAAGEMIAYGAHNAAHLFHSALNNAQPAEVRWAGTQAFHRWMADGIAVGGGRFVGVGEPGPCLDMDATVKELHWLAEHGFTAVSLPGAIVDPDLPPFHDAYYEPFWSTCADLGLNLNIHAGWGMPQGMLAAFAEMFYTETRGDGDGADTGQGAVDLMAAGEAISTDDASPFVLDIGPRRGMWRLMLAGVFDRYPSLQLLLTEVRADWVPPTLRHLDARFLRGGTPLKRKPSEYWHDHCWVTPSAVHTCEIEMRGELGMDKMLFGIDLPHAESTWPNTHDWIRHNFAGVPEDEARAILGERSLDLLGFDRALMRQVADRIGPEPSDILGRFEIAPELLQVFHGRSGMLRGPEDVDTGIIDTVLDEDLDLLKIVR